MSVAATPACKRLVQACLQMRVLLNFVDAPVQAQNVSALAVTWAARGYVPDVVVLGFGPHHMGIHVTPEEYASALQVVANTWQTWHSTKVCAELIFACACTSMPIGPLTRCQFLR